MTNFTQRNNGSENREIEYGQYVRKTQETREEESGFMRGVILGIVILIGILVCIFMFADNEEFLEKHFGEESAVTKVFLKLSRDNAFKEHADFAMPFGPRRQNILLLGVDSNGDDTDVFKGTRSDTMILVNIDPKTKSLNAISIPRDSKVYLPHGHGAQKINAAHALGGIEMTKKTVEETLGVHVDKYIIIHDDAVKEVVAALGGINLYVEKDMHYNDNAGHLHINLVKGDNHLDPEEAVGYLRFRHDAMGDIGRTQRQQWFLRSLLTQLQEPAVIPKIPELVSVAKKYVKTDMSLYEMSQYAALAKHFDIDKIEIAMLPGAPNKKGYVSYWILDPEKTQEVVNRLIYRERVKPSQDHQFVVSILNSNNKETEAANMAKELEELGITVKCRGTSNRTHSQFVSHSKYVTNEYYNWLKKKAPEFKSIQFVYDPVNYYCADTDYTVILAGDK